MATLKFTPTATRWWLTSMAMKFSKSGGRCCCQRHCLRSDLRNVVQALVRFQVRIPEGKSPPAHAKRPERPMSISSCGNGSRGYLGRGQQSYPIWN